MKTIIAISGSLRKNSKNTQLLQLASELVSKEELEVKIHDIQYLPLFSEDIEKEPPKSVVKLQNAVRSSDGLLLATTEYNFLPSGAMKNVIDWLSRGGQASPLFGKTIGIVSAGGYEKGINAQNSVFYSFRRMKWLNLRLIQKPIVAINIGTQPELRVDQEDLQALNEILRQF